MNILFLHNNFPAQFGHIANAVAADRANRVVFATTRRDGAIAGVEKLLFPAPRAPEPLPHLSVQSLDWAVRNAEAMAAAAETLHESGFRPDIVYAHAGRGPMLFVKDLWPEARLVGYFEWYYNATGGDVGFLPDDPEDAAFRMRLRARNAPMLLNLVQADWGVAATEWQRRQYPEPFRGSLQVLHDGIDTDYFSPAPPAPPAVAGTELPAGAELVTYVARGMEPYRGFPQFMRAAALIQRRRPKAHIVVVGADQVVYGRRLPPGESWKQKMLADLAFDRARLHFTGQLPYAAYRELIRASAAHIYLTVPFVLSWSMLEAMSVGGVVIGSDTAPVAEVIRHGENGFLADFFSPEAIADQVENVLAAADPIAEIRRNARQTILDKYDRRVLLPRQIDMLRDVAAGRLGWPR